MSMINKYKIKIIYYHPDYLANEGEEKTLSFEGWYKTFEQAVQHAAHEVYRLENEYKSEILLCVIDYILGVEE